MILCTGYLGGTQRIRRVESKGFILQAKASLEVYKGDTLLHRGWPSQTILVDKHTITDDYAPLCRCPDGTHGDLHCATREPAGG